MKLFYKLFFLLSTLSALAQQDPQYSQYMFNHLVINPAYAGARDAVAIVADIRNQWMGVDGHPKTQTFSIHAPLQKKRIGIGFNAYSDQIGRRSTVGIYGNFAYILPLNNKFKLSFGLRAGLLNQRIRFNDIKYQDQTEATNLAIAHANTRKNVFDMDGGLYLRSNSFYMGVSITHLTKSKMSYKISSVTLFNSTDPYDLNYTLQPHVFFIISKAFQLSENLIFNPTAMVRMQEKFKNGNLDVNLSLLVRQKVWLGVFSRVGYGVGVLLQVQATDKLRIGYTYDIGTGSVSKNLGNAWELMLGFDFNSSKAKMVTPRFL